LTCKTRLPDNLYCVCGDIKHYSIQSNPTFFQCFDTAGWLIRPVKHRLQSDLNCVEWYIKPCLTQLSWQSIRTS